LEITCCVSLKDQIDFYDNIFFAKAGTLEKCITSLALGKLLNNVLSGKEVELAHLSLL
jgi:hypothetical protein